MFVKEFAQKVERAKALGKTIVHRTSPHNALSALEHGLMPYADAAARGIPIESSGYGYHCRWVFNDGNFVFQGKINPKNVKIPDKISFWVDNGNATTRGSTLSHGNGLVLVVDEHYIPLLEKEDLHHVYKGIIPSDDILAVILSGNSFGELQDVASPELTPVRRFMEIQRKTLPPEKWTPLYFKRGDIPYGDKICTLYVPLWVTLV